MQNGKKDATQNSNLSRAAVHFVDHVGENDVFVPLCEVILSQRLLPGGIPANAHVIPVKRSPHTGFYFRVPGERGIFFVREGDQLHDFFFEGGTKEDEEAETERERKKETK